VTCYLAILFYLVLRCFLQTAEIISLLHEATQGPPLAVEAPAGGAKADAQDPSRPEGGIYVTKDKKGPSGPIVRSEDEDDEGEVLALAVSVPVSPANDGTLLSSPSSVPPVLPIFASQRATTSTLPLYAAESGQRANTGSSSAAAAPQSASMVNITPLAGGKGGVNYPNVNPAMNDVAPGTVQVMNLLDVPQASDVEQLASADTGLLDGIPGSMFDYSECFFFWLLAFSIVRARAYDWYQVNGTRFSLG
jgi:hypothetical protein